ncbi:MAG: response regulator transcription factor [Bacillota bacterium]|nr:response regulator transcription factor [Bacillota bacterium]
MIKVMLVDDHSVLRSGLRMLLNSEADLEVIGEAGSGEEALRQLEILTPDVILLDLSMPGMGGLATLKQIKEIKPEIKVLILTMHDDVKYLPSVLEAGASGYVVKKSVDNIVITAIRTVSKGQPYVDSSITSAFITGIINQKKSTENKKEQANLQSLSPREEEVLKFIALGHTNKQIAAELIISVKTVEAHKARIREKLNILKRSELVKYAIENNIVGVKPD